MIQCFLNLIYIMGYMTTNMRRREYLINEKVAWIKVKIFLHIYTHIIVQFKYSQMFFGFKHQINTYRNDRKYAFNKLFVRFLPNLITYQIKILLLYHCTHYYPTAVFLKQLLAFTFNSILCVLRIINQHKSINYLLKIFDNPL